MMRIFTRNKGYKAPEVYNCGFRYARWCINKWEEKFSEKHDSKESYAKLLDMLKRKLSKQRFKATFYIRENFDSSDVLKKNEEITKLIDKLYNIMENDKVWWMRKWVIKALVPLFLNDEEFLTDLITRLHKEENKNVRIEILRSIGKIIDNLEENELICNIKNELIKKLKVEEEKEVKKNLLLVLSKIDPKLITINHIKLIILKNKKQITGRGRSLADNLKKEKRLFNDLRQMLEDVNHELIERAMIAWILANIVYNDKKNIKKEIIFSIEKALDVTEKDKRRKEEMVWFALALLRIDRKNSRGIKTWEKMLALEACSKTQIDEYKIIESNNDQEKKKDKIIEDLQNILKKSYFERSFYDLKFQLKFVNLEVKVKTIRNIIALANSAEQNNNIAYLIIGLKEKKNKIIAMRNIDNYPEIDKKIAECIEYIDPEPSIFYREIKIYKLYTWQQKGLISNEINFTEKQKDPKNREIILVIQIKREPKEVYELAKKIGKFVVGLSWIRVGSHTRNLTQNVRKRLMKT